MRFSVDLGYGFVKAIADNGRTACFPSVVRPDTGPGLAEALDGAAAHLPYRVTVNGQAWLIGRAAQEAGGVRAWSNTLHKESDTHILLLAACALVAEPGQRGPFKLLCGLPPALYAAHKHDAAKELGAIAGSVSIEGAHPINVFFEDEVFVFPQAVGAFYSEALTENGLVKNPHLAETTTGVVDIGYRTTDYLVMTPGPGGIRPVDSLSGSVDVGIGDIYTRAAQRLAGQTFFTISPEEVEHAAAAGRSKIGRIELGPALNDATDEVADEIIRTLKRTWRKEHRLDSILLAGGGGEKLYPALTRAFPAARLVSDPTFANCRGYLAADAALNHRPTTKSPA